MSEQTVSALWVGEMHGDRFLLRDVFQKSGWRLFEAPGRRRALDVLRRHIVQVVLADRDHPRWNWRRALQDLRRMSHPPQLIVVSRTADDSLWAEVLNIGGFDVLRKPFDRDEVERVVASASRHFDPPLRAESLDRAVAAGAA